MESRVEHKYLVPETLRARLRAVIQPFVHPDPHATPREAHGGYRGYTVRSIYYDTSRFAHYFANEDGLAVRAKPRIRGYDSEQADSVAFLEVKKRNGAVGSKARAPMKFTDVPALLASGDIGTHVMSNRSSPSAVTDAEQFLHRVRRFALRPVVTVQYDREPYVGTYETSLRVTFDGDIRSVAYPALSDLYRLEHDRRSLRGSFVLEVKYDSRLGFPVWLRPFLASHGIVRRALSKYSVCLTDLGIVQAHSRTAALARSEWRRRADRRSGFRPHGSEEMAWTR
ncbi:MAG: polyphosphate polymerase domain-containing protein [Acidobacteriota bacterium]